MYDNVHLRFRPLTPTLDGERALRAASVFANVGNYHPDGSIRLKLRNLRIRYWPGQCKGVIWGSLHSFYKGNNLGRFRSDDVATAVEELASEFDLPAEAFEVYRLEAGFNLATPDSPLPFLESLSRAC